MSVTTVQVEVCVDGTITRASARALNRALAAAGIDVRFSGSDRFDGVVRGWAMQAGVQLRVVEAASLKGADKARHTREVTRSRKAQARRCTRAFDAAMAEDDAATSALLAEYAYRRAS